MNARISLRDLLQSRLEEAMRARDRRAISLYRTTLAAIANAEAVPVTDRPAAGAIEAAALGVGASETARRELTEADVADLVRREAGERLTAAEVSGIPDEAREQLLADAQELMGLIE